MDAGRSRTGSREKRGPLNPELWNLRPRSLWPTGVSQLGRRVGGRSLLRFLWPMKHVLSVTILLRSVQASTRTNFLIVFTCGDLLTAWCVVGALVTRGSRRLPERCAGSVMAFQCPTRQTMRRLMVRGCGKGAMRYAGAVITCICTAGVPRLADAPPHQLGGETR